MRIVHRIRILVLTAVMSGLIPAFAWSAADSFAGKKVRDVLDEWSSRIDPIIYSGDLVPARLTFAEDPPPGPPESRLRQALAGLGLALKPAPDGKGFWLVRHQSALSWATTSAPEPAAPSTPPEPILEEVLVTSSRYRFVGDDEASRQELTASRIADLPELGEDALRVVSQLPGTASIGVSARPHIRGGQQDETLVVLNQIELLEPFHLRDFQSLFSAVQPSIVKKIDVYTGGFPARYGDRMSGVLDITLADQYPELGGEFLLSALTTALTGYGSDDDGHWVASARKGNLDWLTKWINPDLGKPAYADVFAQYTSALTEGSAIDVGMLAYRDDIEIRDLEIIDGAGTEEGELARSNDTNAYAWLKWSTGTGTDRSTTIALSASRIRQKRGGFSADEASDETLGFVDDRRRFTTLTLQFGHERPLSASLRLQSGGRITHQRGHYKYAATAEPGDLAELLGNDEEIDRNFDLDFSGTGGNGWVSLLARPGLEFEVESGLRVERYALPRGGLWRVAPRLRFSWLPTDALTLSLSGGRYYQGDAITELSIADGETLFAQPEFADHYIAGMHWRSETGLALRLEAYYKRYGDPAIRYENLFNPLVMLPEIKPDRIRVLASRGYAKGVELSLEYSTEESLRFWTSWSAARVADRVDGQKRRRAWDQAYSARAGWMWTPGAWSFSTTAHWQSGWQTTALPDFIEDFETILLSQNTTDLPDHFSLDVRASRTWQFVDDSLTLWIELINATNRKNVGGLEHEYEELEDGGYQRFTDGRTLLPRVPSIGVLWKFR